MNVVKKKLFVLLFFLAVPLFAGAEENVFIVCENSVEMADWDKEFIRHAKHSIDAAVCFFGGELGREFLKEIEERLIVCHDLQVHILASHFLMERADYEFVNRLISEYPNNFHIEYSDVVPTLRPDVGGFDNHIKAFVIDETYFSFGGTNIDYTQCSDGTRKETRKNTKENFVGKSLASGQRNQDIVGKGPLAKTLRDTVCKSFALWTHYRTTAHFEKEPDAFANNKYYFPVTERPYVERFENSNKLIKLKDNQIKFLISGPHQHKNLITDEYINLIGMAKSEIKIGNLYLFPDETIFKALFDAAKRGVKITIITAGLGGINPEENNYFGWANRVGYLPLLQGKRYNIWDYFSVKNKKPLNVHIYEYDVEDILFHKKWMIVDEHICVIGSYNLCPKSHAFDYETVVVFDSLKIVSESNRIYDIDLKFSRKVSYSEAFDWYFNPTTSVLGESQKKFGGLL